MIRMPLAIPDVMLRIHSPNRTEIAKAISVAPCISTGLPSAIRFVFICFTNRCGSTYLGDLLSSTGFFEPADESLNADNVLPLCRDRGIRSLREYFAHVVRRDARNDTYIVKVAAEQIVLLIEAGILGQIVERSDFLFLNRVDKLAQAISRAIAEQNNRWAWDSPSKIPDCELVYSVERIVQHMYDITILNLSFEQFFGLNGILPIDIEYERLVSAPQPELDQIVRRLRLPALRIDPGKLRIRRQGNEINTAWRSRFLLEAAAPPGSALASIPAQEPTSVEVARQGTATPVSAVVIVAHIRNVGDSRRRMRVVDWSAGKRVVDRGVLHHAASGCGARGYRIPRRTGFRTTSSLGIGRRVLRDARHDHAASRHLCAPPQRGHGYIPVPLFGQVPGRFESWTATSGGGVSIDHPGPPGGVSDRDQSAIAIAATMEPRIWRSGGLASPAR